MLEKLIVTSHCEVPSYLFISERRLESDFAIEKLSQNLFGFLLNNFS